MTAKCGHAISLVFVLLGFVIASKDGEKLLYQLEISKVFVLV